MKTIYIETSIVSYFTARPSRDLLIAAHQEATREVWPDLVSKYESYISTLVHKEASRGNPEQARRRIEALAPFAVLDVEDSAAALAKEIVGERTVPAGAAEDALHIAICAVNGLELLLTWNITHINNPFTRMMVRQTIENAGYRCPEICSPNELIGTSK